MAVYSAANMAGAGTPITETLALGTSYYFDLNSGADTPNVIGTNYFVMEQPTNSSGNYEGVSAFNLNARPITYPASNFPIKSSMIRTPYTLTVALNCVVGTPIRFTFTTDRTINPFDVNFRSTGNVDLRISPV
jgi:hypothetical protein